MPKVGMSALHEACKVSSRVSEKLADNEDVKLILKF
jgi:hypothetical protein